MILNTTVWQGHHDPKANSSDGLGSVRIGLSVAIRRTSSWQPPRADNHRFALEPPVVPRAQTTVRQVTRTLTDNVGHRFEFRRDRARRWQCTVVPVLDLLVHGHRVCVCATGSFPSWRRPTGWSFTPHGGGYQGAHRPPNARTSALDWPRSGDRTCAPISGTVCGL